MLKIVFLGDSLTEGIPGVAYFNLLKNDLLGHELINYGKGGDTVISLNKRVKTLQFNSNIDIIFLWVGVNDVFVNISKSYPIIKRILREPWIKNKEEFPHYYDDTLNFLSSKANRIVVIPPILVGEDTKNVWNNKISDFQDIIKDLTKIYSNVDYLDIRKSFINYLQEKIVSDYVPKSAIRVLLDAFLLNSPEKVDAKSKERGLFLTVDGVHLNSMGATMAAEIIKNYIIQ